MKLYLIVLLNTLRISAIWPPPFKINLETKEEFIIGEDYNENDNEMIKLSNVNDLDTNKYDQLHKLTKRLNDKNHEDNLYFNKNDNNDDNYADLNDPEPFEAGFVDENNTFIDKNIFHYDNFTKQLISNNNKVKEKRSEQVNNDYNYKELNKEYEMLVKSEEKSKKTYNATSFDEHESVKDAVGKIVDFKSTPRNCTAEELQGIGFGAAKCVWIDVKTSKQEPKKNLFKKIIRLTSIWLSIYLIIAIPCWCQRGWCCCWFQCKFCKPRKQIQEAQKYVMDNPPGTYVNQKKKIIHFKPTVYEIHAYEKLKNKLMNL